MDIQTLTNHYTRLPTSWRLVRLGDVLADIIGGGTPSRNEPNYWSGQIPWLTVKDMKTRRPSAAQEHISNRAVQESATNVIPPDTIITATRVGLGKVVRVPFATAINQDLKALIVRPELDKSYLEYWILSVAQFLEAIGSGTTVKGIRLETLRQLPFPLAPLDIQRQIVAEIETQFSRLDESVANLKRVRANLKRYRAAVLKAAVEGRLVPTEAELAHREDRSYETGARLLQHILDTRHSHWRAKGKYKEPCALDEANLPKPPEGWAWASWEQIGIAQNGRAFPSSDYCDEGVRLLRPGNLHESGALVWTADNTRQMPSRYADENPDLIVRGNELVMNLTAQSLKDEFLGRLCLTGKREYCLLNQRLARLTPIEISSKFALVVFKSKWFRRFVDGLNTGSLIQHMFTSQLATFAFPIPPLAEQHRIVAEVDRRWSVVCELESMVAKSLMRGAALRQSFLAQSFLRTP